MEILNYIKVTETLHTSGQPTEGEFSIIRGAGAATVVNLAMPDSDGALQDEGSIVTSLGMNYVHIPVVWDNPKEEQYKLFCTFLKSQLQSNVVWVHCALNWRVSSFAYLFQVNEMGVNKQLAYEALLKVWTPNEVWNKFLTRLA